MSIVEKAAEKLKTRKPGPAAPLSAEIEPAHEGSTIERLQEQAARMDDHVDATEVWHVDQLVLEQAGLLPADDEANYRLADELRRIKRPLLDNATGRGATALTHAQRIVVTSAVPDEGKTFTAVNLALSLAREPDFEVVLVDADIPKSDVTRVFGLQERPGLIDVLANDGLQTEDILVRTDVPDLLVVPAGGRHPLTSELFGSRRMERVLDELGGRNPHRLLVFDTAPLLATAESQVLAARMGQVVMVVAAGRTRQHEVNLALQGLDDSQYIGLVLNKSRLPASENHYQSYYGQYPRTIEGSA